MPLMKEGGRGRIVNSGGLRHCRWQGVRIRPCR